MIKIDAQFEDKFPGFFAAWPEMSRQAMTRAGVFMERRAYDLAPKASHDMANNLGFEADERECVLFGAVKYTEYREGKPFFDRFMGQALDEASAKLGEFFDFG